MRKTVLIGIGVLLALYFGGKAYISSHGKEYFQEYLAAAKKAQKSGVEFELQEYENSFGGAEATVKIRFAQNVDPIRNPLIVKSRVDYGPFFGFRPGLIRIETRKELTDLLTPDGVNKVQKSLQKPVRIDYSGLMDWTHVMHEDAEISSIQVADGNRSLLSIAPIEIDGAYALKDLAGRWSFQTATVEYKDERSKKRLELKAPSIKVELQAMEPSGLMFGAYRMDVDEAMVDAAERGVKEAMTFSGGLGIGLKKLDPERAELRLALGLESRSEATTKTWEGIEKVSLKLQMKDLGVKGLEKLVALQKEREKIQMELAQAMGVKDDAAMQKAILALQMLDDRWIGIYNTLFVPGRTTLHLEEKIQASKLSRLVLDLRYTGKPLQGNAMSAMISLMANAGNLAEGSFDLSLEKALAKKLYPNAVFVLDSMVSKNMANLKEGVYHLKGELKGGKIVINGTQYAPQELMMLILM